MIYKIDKRELSIAIKMLNEVNNELNKQERKERELKKKLNDTKTAIEIVGFNVMKYRVEKGLTVDELAEKSGIGSTTIRMMQLQKYNPTIYTLEKIAIALRVDLVNFFIIEQ